MNFRTVGELRGGRGGHPSEEVLAKRLKEPDVVLTPAIDTSERQTPLLRRAWVRSKVMCPNSVNETRLGERRHASKGDQ